MKRSSTRERRPEPVFFTDRDLGREVPRILADGGLIVHPHHVVFAGRQTVPDPEWLRLVGQRGWVALTHNKAIRYERDQLDDLMAHGATTFFIIGKGPHSEYAAAVLRVVAKMKKLIRRQPRPFIAKIFQSRPEVELWVTYDEWRVGRRQYPSRGR